MKHCIRGLWLAVLSIPLLASAAELPSRRFQLPIDPAARALQLPPLNAEKALAEDALADKGRPLRYALVHKAGVDLRDERKSAPGRWSEVDAAHDLWRVRIDAPGAVSIDLALAPFHLPAGAEAWLSDASGKFLRGPYTAADNPKFGEFWTPYVPGDVAYLEVLVPKAARGELQFGIKSVQQAYRSIESGDSPFAKSGSCNVDVVCPEGNNYRDQINAVARYSVGGGLCTGELVNNTAQNKRRLLLTANHCFSTQADASTVVAYWKYENPTCRTPGSSSSGTPICSPLDAACFASASIAQTGGATLLATYQPADTTLVELNTEVPAAANPFWLGWDRSLDVPASAVGIHHPQGDEKRITFENQPLSNNDVTVPGVPGSRHWHVSNWDLGTTEPGSSGSVLLNPQKRLVGVLSGGAATCSNNVDDYYGRLNIAWEGGGTAASRVRDHLDPAGSGATAIDGRGACTAPTLWSAATPGSTDAAIEVTTHVSGGTGPYTLTWEVDGDAVVDRTQTGVTSQHTLRLTYPTRKTALVTVTATDATGCPASDSWNLPVAGPQLSATPQGSTSQVCGDGDSNFEPGEIWNVPVRVSNNGNDAMNDGFAIFTGGSVPGTAADGSGITDSFGYRALSSASSSDCDYQAVDMSGATLLTPTSSDDGYVANLAVGGGAGFQFYDSTISTLMLSTNGYLTTNPADGGNDYAAACGVDSHAGVVDGRIQVLHDDLVIRAGGSVRHQHFATCPRASDAGSASQGCTVFEWRNMGRYVQGGSPTGNAVFQAILYDSSFEIVYQYLTADSGNGGGASIGLQKPDETVRLNYACDAANAAPAGTAVCLFHPSAPALGATDANLHVVSAANALDNLAAGASRDVTVSAYLDPGAVCGTRAVVSFLGGVDDFAYSFAPNKVLNVAVPASGNCQVATQCAAQLVSLGAPSAAGGMYWNPNRSGNGQNIFNIGSVFSSAWFTGEADRSPVWYLMAGPWNPSYSQAAATINRFTRTSGSPFAVAATAVGTTQFTRGDDDAAYIATWQFDGVWGGEKLSRFYPSSDLPSPNHTGGWYNPSESGWGVVVDEHRIGGQASTGMIGYLYDAANQPRWTLGEQYNTSITVTHNAFFVHCPSCARFDDFGATATAVGSMTRSYQSQTTGTLDMSISLPAPFGGSWNRSALPIQMITPPLSPSP
ncbi:MAG: hypothetical protein IPG63_04545 [Xanthomonadales bacterium]|nr:hypothetical protein [Xanthomonadales bacterium]